MALETADIGRDPADEGNAVGLVADLGGTGLRVGPVDWFVAILALQAARIVRNRLPILPLHPADHHLRILDRASVKPRR
jgi:hypothetical protein